MQYSVTLVSILRLNSLIHFAATTNLTCKSNPWMRIARYLSDSCSVPQGTMSRSDTGVRSKSMWASFAPACQPFVP
jgi:hypothetical protein